MNERDKALMALKKQIKDQRARLDPRILDLAEKAAKGEQKKEDLIPYDKKAAAETIRLFLEKHPDASAFEKKLIARLEKK